MFPAFIPPNVKRNNEKPVILSDGRVVPAERFFESLGGLGELRLMATPGSATPRLSRTHTRAHGEIYCLSFASLRDAEGRVTYGAILFPRTMLEGGELWRMISVQSVEALIPGAGRALAWLRPQFEVILPRAPASLVRPRRRRRRVLAALLFSFSAMVIVFWIYFMLR